MWHLLRHQAMRALSDSRMWAHKLDGEAGYDNPGSPSACPLVICGGEHVSLSLKNWGGGKNTHSVLELSPSHPMWILSPNRAKWECMRFVPAVSALRSGKGKAPSSTYSSWNISNAVSLVEVYARVFSYKSDLFDK